MLSYSDFFWPGTFSCRLAQTRGAFPMNPPFTALYAPQSLHTTCSVMPRSNRWLVRRACGRRRRPVATPRIGRAVRCVTDTNRHHGESMEQSGFGAYGPPVVQKDFQRSPHRNPAADRKTFTQDIDDTARIDPPSEKLTEGDGRTQECEPDNETD